MSKNKDDEVVSADSAMDYQIVLAIVRRQYASVAWTHKVHEKQAEIYADKYRALETLNILFATLTTCGIGSTFLTDEIWAKLLSVACSFITVAIAAYYKSFDIRGRSEINKAAANQFVPIRNDLLQIIADLHRQKDPADEIEARFCDVMNRLNELYASAPPVSRDAVKRATEAMHDESTYALSDADIDKLLPSLLRGQILQQ